MCVFYCLDLSKVVYLRRFGVLSYPVLREMLWCCAVVK